MSLLPQTTLQFFEDYQAQFSSYEGAAAEARAVVSLALEGTGAGIQAVTARAKDPYSLLDKLRQKEYTDPAVEIKDLIGVRVVTNYPDRVESAAEHLRPLLTVDDDESYDRLDLLGADVFGYRSVHLVVHLPEHEAAVRKHLGSQWFEIQIRSLLQDAWATIEHEVQYKSGVDFPPELGRRLAAVAGSLETLDYAFLGIRESGQNLIDHYRSTYEADKDHDVSFDAARLVGCLESLLPEGAAFRGTVSPIGGTASHIEKLLRDALGMVGIRTRGQLEKALKGREVQRLLKKHAGAIGTTTQQLSHTVVCICLIWVENQEVLTKQFPELLFDSELATTLGFKLQNDI
ncbi:MAG TPA: hypothetical protein VFJ64_11725 [Solirubrobacterales bacterium]|nr:hypothetical protein [Solirubrobacterales bacterium]